VGSVRNRIVVAGLLMTLLLAFANGAFAAKGAGHRGGGGDLKLVVVSSPYNDAQAHFDGQVTFEVSTTATDKPSVGVDCDQGQTRVYWASAGFYPEYPWPWAQTFTLRSNYWTGGAAECTATLYYVNSRGRSTTITTLDFHVDA